MIVRCLVYKMCYRYCLHRKDIPGKPDLVFPGRHKVIFIHGCFNHAARRYWVGCIGDLGIPDHQL